jgi:hypothetical protein
MAKNDKPVVVTIKEETAVWLRTVLENMQVQGPAKAVRPLLVKQAEILDQLPGGENDQESA